MFKLSVCALCESESFLIGDPFSAFVNLSVRLFLQPHLDVHLDLS